MNNRILSARPLHTDLAALSLRLILGGLFVRIGYNKLAAYDEMLAMFGDPIGIGSELSLILVSFAEFFCAILVTIGFLTRLSVIPITITMIVAYFVAHEKDAFDMKQLPLVFMLLTIVVFILGAGRYSLDALIFDRRKGD